MPYIIDGNNLIGCSPDIALDDPEARSKMIEIVRKFQESRNVKITVVFDGDPKTANYKNPINSKMTVMYPHFGSTADDVIKNLLERYSQLHEVVIVTSDRALKQFAKEKGARTVNAIEFYYELRKTVHISGKREETQKRINTSVSKSEVDQWMKIFNDDN